jgi:REP element-mobilizing transposase RayT
MWQRSYWDRHARVDGDVQMMADYILEAPVRAGLCAQWWEWPFSWSRWHGQTRGCVAA